MQRQKDIAAGRLVEVLRGLGWNVLVCDPPRQASEGGDYVSLEQIIEQCDVISLHTPLTKSGNGSTWHLFDRDRLSRLKPGTWLINASRGPVVDNQALRRLCRQLGSLLALRILPERVIRWLTAALTIWAGSRLLLG